MDIDEMTPEQLRELATAKEEERVQLESKYLQFKPVKTSGRLEPYERELEFEGEHYIVDMRRIKSRRFVQLIADVQRVQNKEDSEKLPATLKLYEYLFGGTCDEHVVGVVEDKLGYDDAEEIFRIENALMEMLDTKN